MQKWIYLLLLCVLVLPFKLSADVYERGDCNEDGSVDIDDVTTLISFVLNGQWPEIPSGENEMVTYVLNGIEINMVYVEGGTFTMGASGADLDASANEYPAHLVTLSDYYICTTEVTLQLWRAVMGENLPYYGDYNLLNPAHQVSWNKCQDFLTKLNNMTGKNFRMPTEAEWEYAARGGKKSKGYKYVGSDDVDEVAWYKGNCTSSSTVKLQPVAQKLPNELGLYDMAGNVLEWCSDWYGSYYDTDGSVNPQGPSSGTERVLRGGDWYSDAKNCRPTYRRSAKPTMQANNSTGATMWEGFGLRLALSCEE